MNLYRRSILRASLAVLLAGLISIAMGQSLRRKAHRLRATSLAEVTIDTHGIMTARLIPITVLDDGTYHDASIYKSAPQPMVLDQGVVYEVQKTGQPLGYLTVGKASKDKNKGWTALGKWQVANQTSKRASATPAPADTPDERPILHRPGSTPTGTPAPAAAATPSPGSTPSPSAPEDANDRPVLHRPSSAATPAPSPAAASPSPSPAVTPAPPSQPAAAADDDPNRPTLRRRTPPGAQTSETSASEQPTAAKPTQPARPTVAPAELINTPGTQLLVAVSDEQSTDTRSYQFLWKPGEEAPIDAKLRRLALAQLAGPVNESSLTNVSIRSFDLDLSNDAVMVISAEVPPVPSKPIKRGTKGAATETNSAPPGAIRYITLIARVDFEGNPQKLAFSVTDSSRLDVAPRLELIDAVDVDGDGVAELLFRQHSFDETSYVIYQIGRSTVTKLFEGASQTK